MESSLQPNKEEVLKAIYESGLHQYSNGVISTKWKDGIDLDEPSHAIMIFVRKIFDNVNIKTSNKNNCYEQ